MKVHSFSHSLCFSGAKIADINHHIVPLLERKPGKVILHIGTNDIGVSEKDNAQIAAELIKLTRKVTNANIRYSLSFFINKKR